MLPPGVTLVPESCRVAHTATGEGLHLRLRLEVDQHTGIHGFTDLVPIGSDAQVSSTS